MIVCSSISNESTVSVGDLFNVLFDFLDGGSGGGGEFGKGI